MKLSCSLLIAGACFLYAGALFAQLPLYSITPAYTINKDENSRHYKNEMEKLEKAGHFRGASANALQLLISGKEKHKDDAKKFLDAHLAKTIETSEAEIAHKKTEIAEFRGEETAQKANEIVNIYYELDQLKKLSEGVKNKGNGAYEIPPNPNEMENAEKARKSVFEKTAQMYFNEVQKDLPASKWREDYYQQAKKLERALKYDQRQDISIKLEEIKPAATISFGVGLITDASGNSGASMNDIRSALYFQILNDMKHDKKSQPYFDLVPNDESLIPDKANVILTAEIRGINVEQTSDQPRTEDVPGEIKDKEGRKLAVRAKYTEYGKTAITKVEGTYTIKDTQTGKILKSNTISASDRWRHEWATYSGDERALSRMQKNKTQIKESPLPPRAELVRNALANQVDGFIALLSREVMKFANESGK